MKADWNFWDWISGNDADDRERFGDAKRTIVGIIVFLLIPILIYFFVKWDPVIGLNEDGEPNQVVGIYVILGLYWGGAYFAYKRDETRRRLNCLLDKLLSQDEEEFNNLFEIAKKRRKDTKEDKFELEAGEKRLQWFDIQ